MLLCRFSIGGYSFNDHFEKPPELLEAFQAENLEDATRLLEQGADLNEIFYSFDCYKRGQCNDTTVLHYLMRHCGQQFRADLINSIVTSQGGSLRDECLRLLLPQAIDRADADLVKVLLDNDVDPHVSFGTTPFQQNNILLEAYHRRYQVDKHREIDQELKKYIRDLPSFYGLNFHFNDGTNPVARPSSTGLELLDKNMDEVHFYISIINEYKNTKKLSRETIDALNNKLDEAAVLFTSTIENGPNFAVAQPFWLALQQEMSDIKSSGLINIAIIHIIGLKLSLIADVSRISNEEASNLFLAMRAPRMRDLCAHYTSRAKTATLAELLVMHSLHDFAQFDYESLLKMVPIIKNNPIFGIQSFFYAALNRNRLLAYSPLGSVDAHGGFIRSFYTDLQWSTTMPMEFHNRAAFEDFDSSSMLLQHDWMHIKIYEELFYSFEKDSFNLYATLFSEATKEYLKNKDNLLDFALLIILFHEHGSIICSDHKKHFVPLEYNTQSKKSAAEVYGCKTELEFIIATAYPAFEYFTASLEKEYETSHPGEFELGRKNRASFENIDIALLLQACGAKMELDPQAPSTYGPEIVRVLLERLRNYPMGQTLLKHATEIRLE